MVVNGKQIVKVVHVHFLHNRMNRYFGSVAAIFKHFTVEDIGCTERYLRKILLQDGNHYLNDKVLVVRSHLIR